MNVLVIGNGAREHAIVQNLLQDSRVSDIFVSPTHENVIPESTMLRIPANDFYHLDTFVRANDVEFVFVGPEEPLVRGIVNHFQQLSLGDRIYGPQRATAQLEGSKIYAKGFMQANGIPTARFAVVENLRQAEQEISRQMRINGGVVVKADGLYGGKGVYVCHTKDEALSAARTLMRGSNPAGHRIVLEEVLEGAEVSAFAFCDGKSATLVPFGIQDYKRAFDGNEGPNTGGMGAVGPVEIDCAEIEMNFLHPTMSGLEKITAPYKGVLYLGLMKTQSGLKLLEYNCRLGDPEAQILLAKMKTSLLDIAAATKNEDLKNLNVEFDAGAACAVVLASGGYPEEYKAGFMVTGLEPEPNVRLYRSAIGAGGKTAGGRVLTVVGLGATQAEARSRAYTEIGPGKIHFEGMQFRKDIGA